SVGRAIGFAATMTNTWTAAFAGLLIEIGIVLLAWEGIVRLYEYMSGTETPWWMKPSGIPGAAMGSITDAIMPKQGFANGGVVQSEGYDQVTGSPDDTIITVMAGEIVIDPKKMRQGFANAPGSFLGPSMGVSVSAVETTYQANVTATLLEDGNR